LKSQVQSNPTPNGLQKPPISAAGNVSQPVVQRLTSSPPPYYSNYSNISAALPSLYAAGEDTITTKPTSTVSLSAHDAVFQDFSSRQLLLTAGASDSSDDDAEADVDGDPRQRSDDASTDAMETVVHFRLRDDFGDSLDTLQRERAAIDQVLAALHQPEQLAEAHVADGAHGRSSAEAEPVFIAEDHQATGNQLSELPAVNDSGMVLLQAGGDANSSAYDLTAAIASGVDHSIAIPGRAEAAIGIYQAFDVSGVESRSAETKEAPRGNRVAIGQIAAAESDAGA
jgi:hypothetical protein